MPTENTKNGGSAGTSGFAKLVEWSERDGRPGWQRDALRRLVRNGNLSETDDAELLTLCRQARGLAVDTKPVTPNPLSSADVVAYESGAQNISLIAIKGVQGANALPPDASIHLAPDSGESQSAGLILVYGGNASGKSSFARILRSACYARGKGPQIRPNIYDETPSPTTRATIRYRHGTNETSFEWSLDAEPDPNLKTVTFFDESVLIAQLSGLNAVEFLPQELFVLRELAGACQRIREILQADKDQLERSRPLVNRDTQIRTSTRAGQILHSLNHEDQFESIKSLARLSPEDDARRSELTRTLAENPRHDARELQAKVARLRQLQRSLSSLDASTAIPSLEKCQEVLREVQVTQKAARLAAQESFTNEPLSGVGSLAWRRLWDAARRYSEDEAYPARDFPVTESGIRCVLCHQPLSDTAQDRLKRFEAFVQRETQTAATTANRALEDLTEKLERITIDREPSIQGGIRELRSIDRSEATIVKRYLRGLRSRVRLLRKALSSRRSPSFLPTIPSCPVDRLDTLIATLVQRAEELEALAGSNRRRRLQEELAELEDKKRLHDLLPLVEQEIHILRKLHNIEGALRDVDTTQITRESSRLAQALVDAGLKEHFEDELGKLEFNTAQVALDFAGGRIGTPQFRIQLVAHSNAPVSDILSEGEKRCVALAGFLAELGLRQNSSALVLDDPVTSLDHTWRERAARRLAQEALARQVIIFTHDLVFMSQLIKEAHRLGTILHPSEVVRLGKHLGTLRRGKPWFLLGVKDRIAVLRERQLELAQLERNGEAEAYEILYPKLYGDLRETWEQAVQEVLFNNAIKRFDRDVRVGLITKAAAITTEDLQTIDENYSRCSRYFAGHNASAADNPSPPTAAMFLADVEACKRWVSSARGRLT